MASLRETEILYARSESLVLGIFGHGDDERGQVVSRYSGSGVLVSPCQALTAAHVVRDTHRVNPDHADDLLSPNRRGYSVLPHWCTAFQVVDSGKPTSRSAFWAITRIWDPRVTDLVFMQVAPDGEVATERLAAVPFGMFPEWSLLPPPEGAQVEMIGLPTANVHLDTTGVRCSGPYVLQQATVTKVYEIQRERGLYSFPCFTVDQPVEPGFSGGGVFWDGKLCGLISGDSFGATYIATLWPLCLMEIEYPDLGILNKPCTIGDLFDNGVLRSNDWPALRSRVFARIDEHGRQYAHIEPVSRFDEQAHDAGS